MRIWRISNFADLSGRGGLVGEGRWHRLGTPIVYCADHPSTALLEILVHATRQTIPESYQLIEIEAPDGIDIFEPFLPDNWSVDENLTQSTGSRFIETNRSALCRVPSVIMPRAANYLLNPMHADAANVRVAATYRYPFDSRLLR